MDKQMMQYESNDFPPEEIFLQWMGYDEESTWCSDITGDEDIHYVRGDIYGEVLAMNAELLTACKDTAAWFSKFCLTHSFIFAGAPELVDAVNAAIASARGNDADNDG